MKCKSKERIISQAKKAAKKTPNPPKCAMFSDGRSVYSYTYLNEDWDPSISGIEFCFKRGSQYIYVDVITPVSALHDELSSIAHEKHPLPDHLGFRTYKSTPNYKYLGKNKKRKRIVSYTMDTSEPVDSKLMKFSDWSKLVDLEVEKLLNQGEIKIQPSIKVEQFRYGKYVTITSEVKYNCTYRDLIYYAMMVEQILGGSTVVDVLGDTVYDSSYYRKEMAGYETRRLHRESVLATP